MDRCYTERARAKGSYICVTCPVACPPNCRLQRYHSYCYIPHNTTGNVLELLLMSVVELCTTVCMQLLFCMAKEFNLIHFAKGRAC